jgi:hypothetical protein
MKIKFTVDAAVLNKALKISTLVSPQVTIDQQRGHLFLVKDGTCNIYAMDSKHEVRSGFVVDEVEGEGAFMYPADFIPMFEFVTGPVVFEATSESMEDGGESFKVKFFHGSSVVDRTSFNPRSMNLFESNIQEVIATQEPKEFNIKMLQMALGMAKIFLPKTGQSISYEHYKTIQIFGDDADPTLAKKANGYLYASNGNEAFYFYCDAFREKGLAVSLEHLSFLESFMAQSSGNLKVYKTPTRTYVINEANDVIGWPRSHEVYTKFMYYTKDDTIITQVNCESMHRQLMFMRKGLGPDLNKKKIRIHFLPSTGEFWFSSTDERDEIKSLSVSSEKIIASKVEDEIVSSVNVNHMLHLFDNAKGQWVEFRIMRLAASEGRKTDKFMFRTIDEFFLSEEGTIAGGKTGVTPDKVYTCAVTRFAPGID